MSPESSPDGRGRKRVTQKEFCVTLKRLSSKDWTHPNPLHPLLGGSRTYPVRSLRDFFGAFGSPSYVFLRKTNHISTPCTPYQGDLAPARCGPSGTCQGILGLPLTSFFERRTISQPPAPPSGGSRTCPVRSLRDLSRDFVGILGLPPLIFPDFISAEPRYC